MRKFLSSILGICLFSFSANAAVLPDGFVEQLLADSLNPVSMTVDHHGNLWIVEKHGQVRIYDPHQGLLADPFIQIPVDDYNERGLLGIALHPDFDNNPYVYLYYTVPGGNHNRVSRFLSNGALAVPGSEQIILDLDTLSGYVHNGGAMLFGPDGKLYIATGEAAYPPFSQDFNSLHGKILRLEADGAIPPDNPFYGQLIGNARAIWALGLRNPFSFAYDTVSNQFYTIDVGGGEFEEINQLQSGKNYGWPQIEGPIANQQPPLNYVDPLFDYDHNEGCSIVGAAFNQLSGNYFPVEYQGHFFFADYCQGYIKSYDPGTQTASLFADQINRPLAIAFSQESGKMYYLTRAGIGGGSAADNTITQQGQLWEISFAGSGAPFVSFQPQSTLISLGENADFQIRASGSQPLTYQWFQNGMALVGETEPDLSLLVPALSDSGSLVHCILSNSDGTDTSQLAELQVTTNQRPMPIIQSPLEGTGFKAGDTIFFSGTALDIEEGELAPEQLNWSVAWHHNAHTHPGPAPFIATNNGSWIVPRVNETDTNVWYRLHLTATDSMGMSQTESVDLQPEIGPIHLRGPDGVEVNIDGRRRSLPYTFYSLIGLNRLVEALSTSVVEDTLYRFLSWGNGATNPIWEGKSEEGEVRLDLVYEAFVLGNGEGLWGSYYNDSTSGFDTEPVLERKEPNLDFLWGDDSPDELLVNKDYFTARWEGEIQAVFEETYTFHIRSDDGVRLWVADQLIIDKWIPQAPTEHTASIKLEEGRRYHILLEYFELEGGAEMVLEWSSPSTPKSKIPTRQLYANDEQFLGTIEGRVWLDANQNLLLDEGEQKLRGIPVLLFQAEDSSLVQQTSTNQEGDFIFDKIAAQSYYLQFLTATEGSLLEGVKDIDLFGRTPSFTLEEAQNLFVPAAFSVLNSNWFSAFPHLMIFPQPAESEIQLSFAHLHPTEFEIRIVDLSGKRLLLQKGRSHAGKNNIPLNLKSLPAGMYILSLHSSAGWALRKIIRL